MSGRTRNEGYREAASSSSSEEDPEEELQDDVDVDVDEDDFESQADEDSGGTLDKCGRHQFLSDLEGKRRSPFIATTRTASLKKSAMATYHSMVQWAPDCVVPPRIG